MHPAFRPRSLGQVVTAASKAVLPGRTRNVGTAVAAALTLAAGLLVTTAVTARAAPTLLSQGKTATASSLENATFPASNAVDGNTGTRWSSAFSDPQWIQVDLGSTQTICQVTLNWEAAYGKAFQIQTSPDAATWTSIFSTTTGTGGIQTLTVSGTGRYIRMFGTVRGTPYGYSLWEFSVFTTSGGGGGDTTPPSAPAGLTASGTTANSTNLTWNASTDNVGVTGYDVLQNGATVATATGPSYTATGLSPSTAYTFQVKAFDAAGNVSAGSNTVSVTTSAGGGTGAPPPSFWGDTSTIPAAHNVLELEILNRTNGQYPDSQVFWSFNGQTASIAQQPFIDMPANSAGRMYFYLGSPNSQYFDFIEFTVGATFINTDTTRVARFGLKLAMLL